MSKKSIILIFLCAAAMALCGCSGNDYTVRAGMVVPADTVMDDDGNFLDSYMESVWLGLYGARENKLEFQLDSDGNKVKAEDGSFIITNEPIIIKKQVAKEDTDEGYKNAVKSLYDSGYRLIFLPGVEFESIFAAVASEYSDCNFVAIDFSPENMTDNMSAIFCDGETSGFLAGFTAALRIETGRFGAITAHEDTNNAALTKGFIRGVTYANENYGTSVQVQSADFITIDTFSDINLGQQLAAQLFDDGVCCIFIPARASGFGALIEGKYRRANGDDVWIVGCDIDQYTNGIFDGNKSVTVCTAMRRYANGVYDITVDLIDGEFPGGETYLCDITNNGVGISGSGNNLTVEIREIYDELVLEMAKD